MATTIEYIKDAYRLFMENKKFTEQVDMRTEARVEYPASILLEKVITADN